MKNRSLAALVSAIALALMLIPAAALGQSLDPVYRAVSNAGVHVDELKVIPVEGIVVVRGRVHDQESRARISTILKDLGYLRVANMLKITPPPNDEEIQRVAERELGINRSLEGARLRVQSLNGVVTIQGKVLYELQRDAAVNIVRGIDGVKDVQYFIDRM